MPYLMDGELSLTTNLDGEIGAIEQTPPTEFILHLVYDEELEKVVPIEPFNEVWGAHKAGMDVYVDCDTLYEGGVNTDQTCAYIYFSDGVHDPPEYFIELRWVSNTDIYCQQISVGRNGDVWNGNPIRYRNDSET